MKIPFNVGSFTNISRTRANNYNKNTSDIAVNNKRNHIVYMKTDDMLYSGGSGNGMSFTVKYAENSSKENPIVVAKGVDENGKKFEQTFNINDIDLTNISKVEMHALEGHLKLDRQGSLSTLPYESAPMGLNDKADLLAMFKESIDMNLNRGGSRSLGLKHIKNLKFFSDFAKENALATKNNASPNDIYLKESSNTTRSIGSLDNTPTKESFYNGIPLKTWSLNDPKHTDTETGISWYTRDGSPYMLKEDSEKFRKLCEESGEFPLKKFAELTGLIQQLDQNTVAFIGDNATAIKSKDGKELLIDTSKMTYDLIMDMFNNLSKKGDYFDSNYWKDNMDSYIKKNQ